MISTNKATISIIAITVLIISGICYFFLYPTFLKTKEIKKSITITQEQVILAHNQNTTMKKIDQQKDIVKELGIKADNLVPKDPKLEDFLIELEALIAQSKTPTADFQVSSLTSTAPATSDSTLSVIKDARIYQFNVSGQASLGDTLELHNKLITMQRLAEITGITLSTGTDISKLTFQMQGNIFSLNPQAMADVKLDSPAKILADAQIKLGNNKSYAKEIEIQKETGFGRVNPFQGY